MFDTFLADLSEPTEPLKVGDYVALIRRYSNHVVYVKLVDVSTGNTPQAETRWKDRITYRLNVKDNTVNAEDCTVRHAKDMKMWYYIWEPHRLMLMKMCESARIQAKKDKKKLKWKEK